jgi:Delta7-sterol 5-desaturase
MDVVPVLDLWRKVLTVDFLRYFLTAAPFYVLFWLWRPGWVRRRRLQAADPGREQIAWEITYSLSTVLIFSAIGLSLAYAQRAGLTRIYMNVADRGWAYFSASILVAVVAHDAYFYWTGRIVSCIGARCSGSPITSTTDRRARRPGRRTPSILLRP